jgi:DNA adenine methylase
VYNDLDEEVVNVFRVLRDTRQSRELRALLDLTPFARADFEAAYQPARHPVEQARRTIVKAFMGFGSLAIHDPRPCGMRTAASTWRAATGFRAACTRSGTTPAHDWQRYPEHISAFCTRLRGVVIERRAAAEVIAQHDGPATLHYVDPPYVHGTRSGIRGRTPQSRHGYRFEMGDADHVALAEQLHALAGMVVLSGYACELYDRDLYAAWERHERETVADGAKKRTEIVWLNPACAAALGRQRSQQSLGFA